MKLLQMFLLTIKGTIIFKKILPALHPALSPVDSKNPFDINFKEEFAALLIACRFTTPLYILSYQTPTLQNQDLYRTFHPVIYFILELFHSFREATQ